MAESKAPTRGMIVVGDKTTAGGTVTEGSRMSSIKGKAVALQGHTISCPACNSVGHIELVPPFAGAPVEGVEIALSDDLCICGCNPPPRLISSNMGFATHGFSAEELGDPVAAPWLIHAGHDPAEYALPFDEQFLLQDAHGKPLAGVYFSVKLPSGKVMHGTTSSSGLTARYETEGAAHIEVYLGHIGVKFPAPLVKATTNIKAGSVVVAKSERLAKPWKTTNKVLGFMGEWESGVLNGTNYLGQKVVSGMILKVYADGRGIPTVGMGHRVYPNDNLAMDQEINLDRAFEFTRADIGKVEVRLNEVVKVPLHQYEFDAMCSVLFHTGIEHSENDTSPLTRAERVANAVNTGAYSDVPAFINGFFSAKQPKRRLSESRIFETGTYDASH